jgi:hypothetical protein
MTAEELSEISSGAALGLGLRGMRERIQDFGGELEILCLGQGTKIKATIPIEAGRSRTFTAQAEAGALSNGVRNGPSLTNTVAKRAGVN